MNHVITGSLGHISKPLAQQLLAAGHNVTVVSSRPENTAAIEALGAKAAIGKVEDVDFLTRTFTGADAVYTMVPPKWDAADWKKHIAQIGANYAAAIKAAGVKKVVNLSSMGAHLADGCGPVSGLHFVEQALDAIDGADVRHLRPAFFYQNLLANIGMIKHMNIIGGNYGEQTKMVMVDPADIAAVAAAELLDLSFTGKSRVYISGDEKTTHEIASILGKAIGKPELPWINFKDEDAKAGMLQAGLSEEVARNYVEMGTAYRNGKMQEDYTSKTAAVKHGKHSLEDFSEIFASAYNA